MGFCPCIKNIYHPNLFQYLLEISTFTRALSTPPTKDEEAFWSTNWSVPTKWKVCNLTRPAHSSSLIRIWIQGHWLDLITEIEPWSSFRWPFVNSTKRITRSIYMRSTITRTVSPKHPLGLFSIKTVSIYLSVLYLLCTVWPLLSSLYGDRASCRSSKLSQHSVEMCPCIER